MEKNLILTKAKDAILSHDFTTAARLYKMLLKEDPSNVDYLKQLGSIYVQNQEDEKAIPYYEQILSFYPHYIEAMNSLGAIYRRLKRYEESISILQRAIDEGRDAASVNYNLGFTYKEMGNYRDAVESFEQVIHENPDDVLAYNHLGSIYFAQKNYEKSIASYKRGLQIDQNHPILNYNLARCYEAAKNPSDAIRCFQAALKTRPGWVDAINDFSELLIKCQKNKEAQDLVQQSIKLHPTNADLLRLLGCVYLNQYDFSAAEKTFKKADSYKSNDVKILSGLAEALEKGEKVDAALDTVLSALEIDPENKDIRKQYVRTLLTAQDYETAYSNVKELYDQTGDKDLGVLDLYGQYYICQDQEAEAQKYYEKIKRINHHYKDYMLNAASRYSQIGKLDQAQNYANEYIERRPQNPEGYNVLGKIFENKGDLKMAIDSYTKSMSLRTPNALADKKIKQFKEQIINDSLPKEKTVAQVEEPVIEDQVVEPQVEEVAEEPAEEEFDYSVMGGNIPLQEGLLEDEKDFFDSLDDDKEPEPEEEQKEEIPEEEKPQPEIPNFQYNPGDPKDVFDDDGIFDDDAAKKENDSLENGLKDDYEEEPSFEPEESPAPEDEALSDALNTAADEEDDFDFGELPQKKQTPQEEPKAPARNEPYQDPYADREPYNEPANEPYRAPEPPRQQPVPPQMPQQNNAAMEEMERRMQQMSMDNAAHAMEAAFAAQKMAQQLAEQQQLMQEQTKQALQEALDKVEDLQQQKMKEQDKALESLMDDDNIQDETPVMDDQTFEESVTPAEAESEEEIATPMVDELPADDELAEDDFELDLGEENTVEDADSAMDDLLNRETEEIAFEEETPAEEEEVAIEDDLPLDTDFLIGDPAPIEEEPAEDIDFATTDQLSDELLSDDSEPVAEESVDEEIVQEEIIEEPAVEETPLEDNSNEADEMLDKIERILSDDSIASEYKAEIELFKKLRILSEYLPDREKRTFLSCRMRMLIEYIISKMSGKPGLLSTAVALIKSGVLGDEYNDRLADDFPVDSEVRKELIRVVLVDMKSMTDDLADRTLADAMIGTIDNILERLEIEENQSLSFE